jgi:hypothetical protein
MHQAITHGIGDVEAAEEEGEDEVNQINNVIQALPYLLCFATTQR